MVAAGTHIPAVAAGSPSHPAVVDSLAGRRTVTVAGRMPVADSSPPAVVVTGRRQVQGLDAQAAGMRGVDRIFRT